MRSSALVVTLLFAAMFFVVNDSSVKAETPNSTNAKPATVVVQSGDNLSKIATSNETTYVRLYNANEQIRHPDVIHPGQNVRVPAANEQLPERPLPAAATAEPATSASAAVSQQPQRAAYKQKAVKPTRQAKQARPAAASSGGGAWDQLANCEAGGNWSTNTGNGYYGGLQFSASSWRAAGGSGLPHQASKAEQIARAEVLKSKQGWGAWPACTSKMGLR
jgi:LysM repeat protein